MSQYLRIGPNDYYTEFNETLMDFLPKDTTISDNGKVTFLGKVDSISYNMNEYTKEEALKDFANGRMVELYKRKGFRIYKVQEL
jgi:hypothetical protein